MPSLTTHPKWYHMDYRFIIYLWTTILNSLIVFTIPDIDLQQVQIDVTDVNDEVPVFVNEPKPFQAGQRVNRSKAYDSKVDMIVTMRVTNYAPHGRTISFSTSISFCLMLAVVRLIYILPDFLMIDCAKELKKWWIIHWMINWFTEGWV